MHMKTYVKCFVAEMGDYMKKRDKKYGKIRLHYFDMMGHAEPIRMLLQYTGINWQDDRCSETDFEEMKI